MTDRARRDKLACPHCGHGRSLVTDSRPSIDGTRIDRARVCDACLQKFFTVEIIRGPRQEPPPTSSRSM